MTLPPYKNAPITEAVIEIKFAEPIDPAELDKVSAKYAANYPQHQSLQNLRFAVEMPQTGTEKASAEFGRELGHRLASVDMTELLVFWRSSFVISQLAPYQGWDSFHERFVRDWKIWKRSIGFRQISRIGVRYINRIDIPFTGPVVEFEDFLSVYAKTPDSLGNVEAYAVQAVFRIGEIGCQLTLNSAVVPSPILDHASFLFDQDIAKEADPPQSDEDINTLLHEIRTHKNRIFESCITDKARELFLK